MEVLTPRLRLRQWQPSDLAPFAALNADPRVMAFFPGLLDRSQSDAVAERCDAEIAEKGWGFWAIELRQTGQFIGFAGLQEPLMPMPFEPAIEIGWCLAHAHWGQGYATEAAAHALSVAFDWLGLARVVSFTTVGHQRSTAVMRRLGMTPLLDRFEHPALPEDSPLRPHSLYGIERDAWAAQAERLAGSVLGDTRAAEAAPQARPVLAPA